MNTTHYLVQESLPPEIWQEIFMQYAAQIGERPPWILGHIGRYWRQLSLSTPCLWNHIPPFYEEAKNKQQAMKAMFQELLTRSRDALLTLDISCKEDDEDDGDEDQRDIISLLLLHAHRWRNLIINAPSLSIINRRFGGSDAHFPRLSKIFISAIFEKLRPASENNDITFLQHSPELQMVYLIVPETSIQWSTIAGLPWSQITTYYETSSNISTMAHILQTSHLLHSLCLCGKINKLPSLPLVHSRLRDLSLIDRHCVPDLISALDLLSLPALELLCIDSFPLQVENNRIYRHILPALTRFIIRSKCSLKQLSIVARDCPLASQLSDLLQYTPHLKNLRFFIDMRPWWEDTMELLVCEELKQTLVPYLSNLIVDYVNDGSDKEASAIAKVVSSCSSRPEIETLESSAVKMLNTARLNDRSSAATSLPILYTLQGFNFEQMMNTMSNELGDLDVPPYSEHDLKFSELSKWFLMEKAELICCALIDSEEQRLKIPFSRVFLLLDIFHLNCYYKKLHERMEWPRKLEKYKLISSLEDKLHYRTWMFVERSTVYIPSHHKIRKSVYKWDLILGGPVESSKYLAGEADGYPSEIENQYDYITK